MTISTTVTGQENIGQVRHFSLPTSHSPLRILYLQTTGQIGGTEMANFRVWRDRPDNLDIDVCFQKNLFNDIGDVSRMYRDAGYTPVHLNAESQSLAQTRRKFTKLVHENQYDIIHAFGLKNNLLVRTANLPKHTKIVSGQRSIDPWRTSVQNWLDRMTLHRVSHFISNSYAAEKWLQDTFHIPPSKTTTIHQGIDPAPFLMPKSTHLRQELGIGDDEVVVITAANFVPAKAHNILLEAMAEVLKRGPSFQLLLAGEGPQKEALQSQAKQLGITKNVHFLGFRTDMPDVYANADIKVLPTNWEGLPNAVLEAMAAGLPVIGSDVGGVGELIEDEKTGYLVASKSVAQLANALTNLIANPKLREQMGRAGRAVVKANFDPAQKMTALSTIYQQISSS